MPGASSSLITEVKQQSRHHAEATLSLTLLANKHPLIKNLTKQVSLTIILLKSPALKRHPPLPSRWLCWLSPGTSSWRCPAPGLTGSPDPSCPPACNIIIIIIIIILLVPHLLTPSLVSTLNTSWLVVRRLISGPRRRSHDTCTSGTSVHCRGFYS